MKTVMRILSLLLLATVLASQSASAFEIVRPQVDTAGLPAAAKTWDEPNPLRAN